jgi:hypothetical protein
MSSTNVVDWEGDDAAGTEYACYTEGTGDTYTQGCTKHTGGTADTIFYPRLLDY